MIEEDREGRDSSRARDSGVEELELDAGLPPEIIATGIKAQRTYSVLGLVLGAIIVLGGVILIALGFTGSIDIGFHLGETSGHVVTGSLGIVLALIGGLAIWATRFKVTVTRSSKNRRRRSG